MNLGYCTFDFLFVYGFMATRGVGRIGLQVVFVTTSYHFILYRSQLRLLLSNDLRYYLVILYCTTSSPNYIRVMAQDPAIISSPFIFLCHVKTHLCHGS